MRWMEFMWREDRREGNNSSEDESYKGRDRVREVVINGIKQLMLSGGGGGGGGGALHHLTHHSLVKVCVAVWPSSSRSYEHVAVLVNMNHDSKEPCWSALTAESIYGDFPYSHLLSSYPTGEGLGLDHRFAVGREGLLPNNDFVLVINVRAGEGEGGEEEEVEGEAEEEEG